MANPVETRGETTLPPLTRKHLIEWLNGFAPEAAVGSTVSAADCVLTRYLNAGSGIESGWLVGWETLEQLMAERNGQRFLLAPWCTRLVDAIDASAPKKPESRGDGGWGTRASVPVTARQVLEILAGGRPDPAPDQQ